MSGDENPIINNVLVVKKLLVFVMYVTTEFYIFGNEAWVFRLLNLGKFSYLEERLK